MSCGSITVCGVIHSYTYKGVIRIEVEW